MTKTITEMPGAGKSVRQIQMPWASAGLEKKPGETGKGRQGQSFVLPANENYQENHYQVSRGDNLPR